MSEGVWSGGVPVPQLVWLGDGAWVANDPRLPENDPRRVLAYLEQFNDHVTALWVRDRQGWSSFATLREAVQATAVLADRQAKLSATS